MKQHIEINQLSELSKKEKEKLKLFINGGKLHNDGYDFERDVDLAHLTTIGQMIEFLDEYCLETRQDWSINFGKNFALVGTSGNKNGKHMIESKRSVELCDALWNAVKEVLADLRGEIWVQMNKNH